MFKRPEIEFKILIKKRMCELYSMIRPDQKEHYIANIFR